MQSPMPQFVLKCCCMKPPANWLLTFLFFSIPAVAIIYIINELHSLLIPERMLVFWRGLPSCRSWARCGVRRTRRRRIPQQLDRNSWDSPAMPSHSSSPGLITTHLTHLASASFNRCWQTLLFFSCQHRQRRLTKRSGRRLITILMMMQNVMMMMMLMMMMMMQEGMTEMGVVVMLAILMTIPRFLQHILEAKKFFGAKKISSCFYCVRSFTKFVFRFWSIWGAQLWQDRVTRIWEVVRIVKMKETLKRSYKGQCHLEVKKVNFTVLVFYNVWCQCWWELKNMKDV